MQSPEKISLPGTVGIMAFYTFCVPSVFSVVLTEILAVTVQTQLPSGSDQKIVVPGAMGVMARCACAGSHGTMDEFSFINRIVTFHAQPCLGKGPFVDTPGSLRVACLTVIQVQLHMIIVIIQLSEKDSYLLSSDTWSSKNQFVSSLRQSCHVDHGIVFQFRVSRCFTVIQNFNSFSISIAFDFGYDKDL